MSRFLLLGLLVVSLSGCSALLGGADYTYKYVDPSNKTVEVTVHSNRKIAGNVHLSISPDGTVNVQTGALQPGQSELANMVRLLELLTTAPARTATAP